MVTKTVFHWRPSGEKAFGYAQANRAGDLLFVSGCMSVDDNFEVVAPDDMGAQLENVYIAIEKTLGAFGLSFQHVVEEVIYTTDMPAFFVANASRKARYSEDNLPAATVLGVERLAFEGQVIEIKATAAFPDDEVDQQLREDDTRRAVDD